MKNVLYKMKGAVALTLAMTLFCPQVFAAEPVPANVQETETVAAEETLPLLTYEKALEKAIKHSPGLEDINDSLELMRDTEGELEEMVNTSLKVNYDSYQWVTETWYLLTAQAYGLDAGIESNKYMAELTKLGLEVSLKSYFTSILGDEAELEYKKLVEENKRDLYLQGLTKYTLGMLSKYNLNQLQTEYLAAQNETESLKAKLEQEYMTLNHLIGESAEARFQLVYDLEYTPYTLPADMNQYINRKIQNEDISIKLQELAVDQAKFTMNYRSSYSVNAREDDELSYDKARRALKTAKAEKELAIRNAAQNIRQMDLGIASAQAGLEQAKAAYRMVQVNYQAGNVTKTAVEQARLAVMQTELAVQELIYTYDMLTYTFENTSLLGAEAE